MNIFILDEDPIVAASYLADVHVRKMLIESAQMLANGFSLYALVDAPLTQKGTVRRHSYVHHPCSKWAIQTSANFCWLLDHALAICEEYQKRFNGKHFTAEFIHWVWYNVHKSNVPDGELTPFAEAMPDRIPGLTTVERYRLYYCTDKRSLLHWTNVPVPDFVAQHDVWRLGITTVSPYGRVVEPCTQ